MQARIELQNNVVLTGEISMMSEHTITIRVSNIDAITMQQLYSQKISVTKLSRCWSVCANRDKIVGISITDESLD